MEVRVEFDWDKHASGAVRTFLLRYGKLPRSFIEERWMSLTATQQRWALLYQSVSKKFIEGNWDRTHHGAKSYCIQYGKVSIDFVKRYWDEFDPTTRNVCIYHMELPTKFIRWVWGVVVPGCLPGLVERGYLAAKISWKINFAMSLGSAAGAGSGVVKLIKSIGSIKP